MNAQDIVKALTPLADKISQTGAAVYAQYYKQAIVNGYLNIMWGIVFLIVLIAGVVTITLTLKKMKEWGEEAVFFLITFVGMAVIASALILITNIGYAIQNFANPGYQATQNLITTIKGN